MFEAHSEDRRSKTKNKNVFVLGAECGLALPASNIFVFQKKVYRKLSVFDIAAYFNFSRVLLKSFRFYVERGTVTGQSFLW